MNVVVLTLHLVAANPVTAVESFSQNPNWSAWHGCWRADGAPANELVCVTPADGGVRIATLIDGSLRDESRVIADGTARPVQSVGCNGTERAFWSNDRRRVFLESDVACGATGRRAVRGIFVFVAPDEWISVQTATEGDSVATRVVRFTAAESRATPTGLNSLLDVDEAAVNEAVAHIGADAVQEWMRSAGEPFQLGYQPQDRGNGSALEQVGRMSNPVAVREVVRVVERPVYVHDYYDDDYYYDNHYYRWHYSPWGYRYHGWSWYRPGFFVHFPVIVFRNSHYRHDYWRYDSYRYGGYNRDRYRGRNDGWGDRDRDDRDDRDRDGNRGRVTRAGYTSGRERAEPSPSRERTEPRTSAPSVNRAVARSGRSNAAPSRSSGSSSNSTSGSRSATTRTARARSSSN